MADSAVVLLAGGAATRFPGKLDQPIAGEPMLARAYRHVGAAGLPVYIAGKGSLARELDETLDAPLIVDRHPGRGPFNAFLDACAIVRARRLFAVAADQPEFDGTLMERLLTAWKLGDEAVVPVHDGGIEPLAALYDRSAALQSGYRLRIGGRAAMRDLIDSLAARFVRCDARYFRNVNAPEDLLDR